MTDRDNITLPREVVQEALEALEWSWGGEPMGTKELASITALRAHLAAPKQEPDDWIRLHKSGCALFIGGYQCNCGFHQQKGKPSIAAPTVKESLTHPGYVIGSHWLKTAYSRVCAGEAEADVLRDIGLVREEAFLLGVQHLREENEALRRDAERYRWLRNRAWFQYEFEGRYGDSGETVQELDAAIDAAMGEKR